MTYYPDQHDFSEREQQLATVVARQLAFSIDRDRSEEARQSALGRLRESEERFRVLSELAPVMIWMSDAEGHCLYLNKLLREFWGVKQEELLSFQWQSTMHPEDAPKIGQAMIDGINRRQAVTVEGRYRRQSDGAYRWLNTLAQPRWSGEQFLGMMGVNVDATESREAEDILRGSEQRLRVALRAGRMGTWRYDTRTGVQHWDARQYELFGIDPGAPVTREVFLSRVYPPDLANVDVHDGRLPRREGDILDTSFRIVLPDGSLRWLAGHSVGHEFGGAVERIGVNFDITEQKETERKLRLLVDELNHRVKNTLSIVQSLAYQTFKNTSADEARRIFEGRLITLANSHSYLTDESWEGTPLATLLVQAFSTQGVATERFSLLGPPVMLGANQSFALALAFNELCTNATKHGALSNDRGRIQVEWKQPGPLQIVWSEADGPPVSPPKRRGFGSKLIEQSLAKDLNGQLSIKFNPEGVQCFIEIAAPAPAAAN
jgi:PAS domain S-box-containing protein